MKNVPALHRTLALIWGILAIVVPIVLQSTIGKSWAQVTTPGFLAALITTILVGLRQGRPPTLPPPPAGGRRA